jgi:hypothetical protein
VARQPLIDLTGLAEEADLAIPDEHFGGERSNELGVRIDASTHRPPTPHRG